MCDRSTRQNTMTAIAAAGAAILVEGLTPLTRHNVRRMVHEGATRADVLRIYRIAGGPPLMLLGIAAYCDALIALPAGHPGRDPGPEPV